MTLPSDFIASLGPMHPREIFEIFVKKAWPKGGTHFELGNELRPLDLFCYLGARFGSPNGFQNFLRADDSDNLIHWEWTLRHKAGLVSFQGMNFRTEIHIHGDVGATEADKAALVGQVKADFATHGSEMSNARKHLEHWVEFVNPYQRIKLSIDGLLEELAALKLDPDRDALDVFQWETADLAVMKKRAEERGARYSKGFGFCFGIRSMLPVLAEAYINLLIYLLMRPEIRGDDRLRDNVFRQPIDVRIKSLSINCVGFAKQPDYASDACRRYHTLVNERNDLLHGNVAIDKLSFNEVHFWGKVPIFREYRTMWQRSLGVLVNAVGLRTVHADVAVVTDLISYIESCLDDEHKENAKLMSGRYELGLNKATRRIGVLFPPWLTDFRAMRQRPGSAADESRASE
jgi:hypothetical protein